MKKKFRFKDDSFPGAGDGTPIIADSFNPIFERIEKLERHIFYLKIWIVTVCIASLVNQFLGS